MTEHGQDDKMEDVSKMESVSFVPDIVENATLGNFGNSGGEPQATHPHTCRLRIPFPRPEWAEYVRRTLAVDREVKPEMVQRTLSVLGSDLMIEFSAAEVRMLRTSVRSFFDFLDLALQTIDELASA